MSNTIDDLQNVEREFNLSDFAELVRSCRTYRRFDESSPIPECLLLELVDLARVVASGANRLALRYHITTDKNECETIFSRLKWAAALKDWDGPAAGEHPTGYIIICDGGSGATLATDEGIAAQTIVLGATKAGFGACMLHAFNKELLAQDLGFDERGIVPLMVIALGKPAETIILETLAADATSTNYWRDEKDQHHVPKRALDDILV